MILCRSVVLACMFASLIHPLHAQINAKPKKTVSHGNTPVDPYVCSREPGNRCVNLCPAAAQMAAIDDTKPAIPVEGPKGHIASMSNHVEIKLLVGQQIVWTCKTKKFKIDSIAKVWIPDSTTDQGASGAPDFPFDPTPRAYLGVLQPAGSLLHSGPAKCTALNQRYEFHFSFADGPMVDPHFIVTGPDGLGQKTGPCRPVNPHTAPAKPPVKSTK